MAPPLVGVAVNVTFVPAQVGFVPEVMAIVTAACATQFIVIGFDVTVTRFEQASEEMEVIAQLTTCPVVKVFVVYVGLLVPASIPFTFH